ncbi:glycosyltransferase family 2 protein [Weissella cibaria]|nr:glycosyltransferase family 2 protein [Weissella cibaria]
MMTEKDFGLVSVIVANYNNEQYLDRFLQLLGNQTYKNFELIFVDDGSSDNSMQIVKQADVPFKIVSVEKCHGGVAAARNAGIDIAQGDLFVFVDVDDTISDNHIETYVKEITEFEGDIVQIPILKNGKRSVCYDEIIPMNQLTNKILIGEIPGWLVQFGSRRSVWDGISFIDSVDYAEDVFLIKQISTEHPDAIVCIRGKANPTYVYEQHDNSVTNSVSKLTINKILNLCRIVGEKYSQDSDVQLFLKRQMIYAYSLALRLEDFQLTRQIKKELLYGILREYVTWIEIFRIRCGLFSVKSRVILKFFNKSGRTV